MHTYTEQVEHYFPTNSDLWKIFQSANSLLAACVTPIEEIRPQAKEQVKQIFRSWVFLALCVKAHEETIRRRWLKKTKAQRRAVPLKA